MKYLFLILLLFSCSEVIEVGKPVTVIENKNEVELYATWYNMPTLKNIPDGFHVRDVDGSPLGPRLSGKDWCNLAMEGTGRIDGKTYNYAKTTEDHFVDCKYAPSGKSKFYMTTDGFAVGNRGNRLIPFVSIACFQINKRKKTGVYKFGQRFYIPDAVGVILPNGKKHDGYFVCADTGGLIKGNHIDVFIGEETKNPFSFVKSKASGTFKAYLVD